MRARATSAALIGVALSLISAAPAGAGREAKTATDHVVTYLDTGKIEIGKTLEIPLQCSVTCSVSATAQFLVPGPNPPPSPPVNGTFPANTPVVHFIEINKALRKAIKANVKKVKLRSELTATDVATGEVDVDTHVFRFKQ